MRNYDKLLPLLLQSISLVIYYNNNEKKRTFHPDNGLFYDLLELYGFYHKLFTTRRNRIYCSSIALQYINIYAK